MKWRSVVVVIIASLGLVAAVVRVVEYLSKDRCLDAGGRWIAGVCEGARP